MPIAGAATPIVVELDGGSPDSTTGTSLATSGAAGGSLAGDLDGNMLTGLSGEIVRDFGTLTVTGGSFDFSGTTNSWFSTDALGHFDVYQLIADAGRLLIWAKSACTTEGTWSCKSTWVRLSGVFEPPDDKKDPAVPEPSAALLFGLGTVVVSSRISRKR